MNNSALGRQGEAFAAAALEDEGYKILERNFRCCGGEVDLIAEKDGRISFIEVKTRRSLRFGAPAEAVTAEKQRRIRRAACGYLKACGSDSEIQFQVIEVLMRRIPHAF